MPEIVFMGKDGFNVRRALRDFEAALTRIHEAAELASELTAFLRSRAIRGFDHLLLEARASGPLA